MGRNDFQKSKINVRCSLKRYIQLIKSRLFGNGKMLCWETTVEKALEQFSLWRADLITDKAWSLHPGERSKEFHEKNTFDHKTSCPSSFPRGTGRELRSQTWRLGSKLISEHQSIRKISLGSSGIGIHKLHNLPSSSQSSLGR